MRNVSIVKVFKSLFFPEKPTGLKTTSHGMYKVYSSLKTHPDARRFCMLTGGHLASFETKAEFDAFGSSSVELWIGASDQDKEGKKLIMSTLRYIFLSQFYLQTSMYS